MSMVKSRLNCVAGGLDERHSPTIYALTRPSSVDIDLTVLACIVPIYP
jgi:hypothetical protein